MKFEMQMASEAHMDPQTKKDWGNTLVGYGEIQEWTPGKVTINIYDLALSPEWLVSEITSEFDYKILEVTR